MHFPNSAAMDKNGNLYIADEGNARVRKITADGMISTVAGNGTGGSEFTPNFRDVASKPMPTCR